MSNIFYGDITEKALGIENAKQLKRFYTQWSINSSKIIKSYVENESSKLYNVRWRNKSKEIPFYIRLKAPRSFTGSVWFASRPVNATYLKGKNYKPKKIVIPKSIKRIAVKGSQGWFVPKRYKPDIKDILFNELDPDIPVNTSRFFLSKTSHNKTHKYKKPLLWYQSRSLDGSNKSDKKVAPAMLAEQLGDLLYYDPKLYDMIRQGFDQTVSEAKYL